jgi:methylaspartate mutase epsilon subunit
MSTPGLGSASLTDKDFDRERAAVLGSWRTGTEVDIDDAVEFHRSLPAERNVAFVRERAKRTGAILLQPLAGVPRLAEHIDLLRRLEVDGTADILPTQVDSQTRNLRFDAVQSYLDSPRETGPAKLNGFPIVNHGVAGTRELVMSTGRPIEMRIGTVDARLAAEIAFAGGITSMTAGPLYYTAHYSGRVRFADSMRAWQYVFRLAGRYLRNGVRIAMQIHGAGNSTPFPMSILGACCALECLIAAREGVRNFSVDVRFMGNLLQDVAAATVVPEECARYLRESGYEDCVVTVDRKTWAGRYPDDVARAYGLICYNAVTGMLGGVQEFICNSVEEGVGIPSADANAATLRAVRQVTGLLHGQVVRFDSPEYAAEVTTMRSELRALVDTALRLGDGDPATGAVAAFATGAIDVPFAASAQCRGEVMVARDAEGAVRILSPGQMPIPPSALEFNAARLADRERKRGGRKIDYSDVVEDIFSISRGYLVRDQTGEQ